MVRLDENTLPGYWAVRHDAGMWIRDDHTVICFTGSDAAQWLQTQTTNDVASLESGQGHAGCLLDRKGRLHAHFTLHRWEDQFWLIIQKAQRARLSERLETYLFSDDVHIADAGDEVDQLVIQGPRSLAFLARLLDNAGQDSPPLPSDLHACAPVHLLGCRVWAIRLSVTGEDGHVLLPERGEAERLRDAMLELGESFGIREVPLAAREVLRVEAGIPWFGVDMNTDTRVSDTPLEQYAVSYTKGCYLGQEVVAKLKAHGSPRYAMVGLVFEQDKNELPEAESDLIEDGERVGRIASSAFSPALDRPIALAYLDRQHRTPGQELRLGEPGDRAPLSARVQVLPFWEAPSRADRARTLYDKALERFQKDLDDRDHSPLELLEEAVLLDPGFEDAYETLGVILNRQGRVDEAIETMQRLVRLNPDCVMAHTNLSVFYVSKGMVREAEQEKAHAAMLQFKQTQDAKKAKEAAAAERTRIEQQAQDRIRMFKEVLELDPGDVLATYGLGIAHFQLEEYERAVPHLEKATGLKKDYSAAFLNLGKCHEFLKQTDRAREAYQAGIAAASRKGDLMPMREMERRLNALTAATKDSGQ